MENIIDERIRSLARQSKLTVPENYENSIEQLLIRLMAEEKIIPVKKYHRLQKVAAVFIFCFLFGSAGVYATVNYVNQRMQQMKPDEIADYREDLQSSTQEADHYSRELSESEQKRLETLTTQYESKGVFPKGQLLQVESSKDVVSDQLCFVITTSTFYFPNREMTDEELLELIDFYYERDYSIQQKDTQASLENMNTEAMISQDAAVQKAVETVKNIYDIDISQMDYSIDELNNGVETDMNSILIRFGEQEDNTYSVMVNSKTGQISEMSITGKDIYNSKIVADQESYKKQYDSIKDTLQKYFVKTEKMEQSYLTYYEDKSNSVVKNGVIAYVFVLSDGGGYVVNYSCGQQMIYGIRYMDDMESYQERSSQSAQTDQQNNLLQTVIQME